MKNLLAPGAAPKVEPMQQKFESYKANTLQFAWEEGWAACRDAEAVAGNVKNELFGKSITLAHCLTADQLYRKESADSSSQELTKVDRIRNACQRTYNRCGYDAVANACVADGCPNAQHAAPKAQCWCESCDLKANTFRTRMSVCPDCGDKRCPRAINHEMQCAAPKADLIPQDSLFVCGQMGANVTRVYAEQPKLLQCPQCLYCGTMTEDCSEAPDQAAPQTPLSDEQIMDIATRTPLRDTYWLSPKLDGYPDEVREITAFARAIEQAHGIRGEQP